MLTILLHFTAVAATQTIPDPRNILSGAPAFTPTGESERDQTAFRDVELAPLGTVVVGASDYGETWSVTLTGTQKVRGVPCVGRVATDTSGQWGCRLGAAWSSGGLTLPIGTAVSFQIGSAHLYSFGDAPTPIYTRVAGVPCAGSVTFAADGSFLGCQLSAPHTFPGAPELPKGAKVYAADGHVFQAEFSGPVTLGGVRYGEGVVLECGVFLVEFDAAGHITRTGDMGCGC
jgi:hypothetical protein